MPAPTVHGFAEKVALIVNGSEGIGRAAALQLALQGCYVIISYEENSQIQISTVEELKALGTLAHAFPLTEPQKLLNEVNNLFGRLDLLVNCVAPQTDSVSQIERVTDEALILMKSRPKPAIVNVVSEKQKIFFSGNLPGNFRQNCVVSKDTPQIQSDGLYALNNFDDAARVILFFLSNEAKALNQQVLHLS